MSILAAPPPPEAPPLPPALDALPLYRVSVEMYHEMLRQQIFQEDDPVELVEGLLVRKMTKYQPHCFATQTLRDVVPSLLPPGWFVIDQDPVTTSDSEPEPDLTVVRGSRRQYLDERRHPGPADVGLIVEVAESSLPFDRGHKRRAYARAGVPVYWIVNLVDRKVEVYTSPTGPADEPTFQHQQDFGPGDDIPVTLDGHEVGRVRVADILP